MNAERLAYFESKWRAPLVRVLPPKGTVWLYSRGRKIFLNRLLATKPAAVAAPGGLERTCWGLRFRFPLFNAAGMFKNGEGYEICAAQGAGAYLAGTTTANPRAGNTKDGTELPFTPYPLSGSASNWLGLPNDGDEAVARRIREIKRVDGCPIGVSLMGSPDYHGDEKVRLLVRGLKLYEEAGADFLELNESCPNTAHGRPQDDALCDRLEYISKHFLAQRPKNRPLPVIVKFSNDTEPEQVLALVELLVRFGFDGVNFGNTSTAYERRREDIAESERRLFDYFSTTFGGGVSGRPLKADSLKLISAGTAALTDLRPDREFHLIRTGGIETREDLDESLAAGASLAQWFTGYFEAFSKMGSALYRDLSS